MARYNTVTTAATSSGTASISTPAQGLLTTLTGTAPYTVTLAAPALFTGITQSFFNNTGGTVTISTPSGNILGNGFTGATTQTIPNQATYTLTSDGTNYVIVNNEGGPLSVTTITASSTVTLSPANANVAISPTGTGTVTVNPAGALTVAGVSTLTLGTVGQITTLRGNLDASQSNQTVTLSPTGTGSVTISPASNVTINPTGTTSLQGTGAITMAPGTTGNINNMNIGASTRGSGSFTSLTANSAVTFTQGTASSTTGTGTLVVTGGIGVSGQVTAATLVETSSIVFKKTVKPLVNPLDAVLQLKGVTYDRKDGSTKNEAGLIAEEVYKVLPNLVSLDEKGKPYGIQYTKLTAYLIESIKALKKEINDLKKGKK